MAIVAYVNGAFLPESQASVSIFDRGFLFADAIYEVLPVVHGRAINRDAHLQRLQRSLGELRLPTPLAVAQIGDLVDQLIERNELNEGRVYLQISRGPAERDFSFPSDPQPTLVMFSRAAAVLDHPSAKNGLKVCSCDDLRWARRDIKTVMLLASSMAKQQAKERGFDDAWMVQDGLVTEGTSNNAYIVKDGAIRTRPLSNDILGGCTRRALLAVAKEASVQIEERAFSIVEAYAADEAFISSASTFIIPVVQIDEQPIGDGRPGPLSQRLRELYIAELCA